MSQGTGPQDTALPTETKNFGRYRHLLRNRDFRLWFASAATSSLGDWAGLFALQSLVASLSTQGSRVQLFSLGAIMMARTLPSLMLGPVAGVLADRYDRKRLMVVTDIVRAGLFVVIAFTGNLVALFALTFIVESMSLLFASAKDATLASVVDRDDLTEANQLNLIVTYGTLPLGGLMGVLLAALSSLLSGTNLEATSLVLLLNAATFVISALFMSRLSLSASGRRARHEESQGLVAELREGLQFIRNMPVVRALIFGVVGIFFGGGIIFALGPALLEDGDRWYTVVTLVGVGLVLGMVLSAVLASRFPKQRVLGISMTLMAVIACAIALSFDFTRISILAFALGATAGLAFVIGYTLLHEQTYADSETRGTTFATFYTGTRAAMFLALGAAPLVAGAIGRFSLTLGTFNVSLSGLRLTILAGGLLSLYAAFYTMRALWRRVGEDDDMVGGTIAPRARGGGSGLFIAFEGVEGSGKSTQIAKLASTLEGEGHEVVITREPGGHEVSERIRALLLDPACKDMGSRTEALLYAAARAQLVDSVIQPALDAGRIVLSDRFVDSSLAYQGYGRRLGHHEISEINQWATAGLRPDVVIWLKLDPTTGLRRVDARAERQAPVQQGDTRPVGHAGGHLSDADPSDTGTSTPDPPRDGAGGDGPGGDDAPHEAPRGDGAGRDRMERQSGQFHAEVAEAYKQLARLAHRRWITIDADLDPDTVAAEIRAELRPWLPLPSVADAGGARAGKEPAPSRAP